MHFPLFARFKLMSEVTTAALLWVTLHLHLQMGPLLIKCVDCTDYNQCPGQFIKVNCCMNDYMHLATIRAVSLPLLLVGVLPAANCLEPPLGIPHVISRFTSVKGA